MQSNLVIGLVIITRHHQKSRVYSTLNASQAVVYVYIKASCSSRLTRHLPTKMPVEVIDLLSSPSSANDAAPPKRAASPPRRTAGPSRAIDFDVMDLTADQLTTEYPKRSISSLATAGSKARPPVTGTKRTSTGHHRQDNDFMFLSDEFDTVGDLDDPLVAKKSRVSPSSPRGKKNAGTSFRRTASAAVNTADRRPPQLNGMKRCHSLADPIESSSPAHDTFNASNWKKKNEDWLNSLTNSQKRRPIEAAAGETSRLPELLSDDDPFASSSRGSPKAGKKASTGKLDKPANRAAFADLSSDPFDIPLDKLRDKPNKKPAAWDPISSSMPERGANPDPFSSSPPPPPLPRSKSSGQVDDFIDVDDLASSDSDLPDLADIDFAKVRKAKRLYNTSPKNGSTSKKTGKSTSKVADKTPEEKEADRKEKAKQREAQRERKRVQKEQEKAERALENVKKKALEEVNKVRTDKKVSTPEMIVDLPSSLDAGRKLQIQKLLKDMDVEHNIYNSTVDNVVKWRRKVSSRYNEEQGHWEPVRMHIEPEKHVLVIVDAAEFVKLALGIDEQHLEAHVLRMKTGHPDKSIIYLIEGLGPWMRKNRNVRNRQFQSAVRSEDLAPTSTAPSSSSGRRRKNTQPQEYIDEDTVEDALLSLQVLHGTLIHHTSGAPETAQWVSVFTQHISTVPYRRAREAATAGANFCMEAGQVRAGDGPRDVYARMLQEMTRVTPAVALGIAAEFPTVTSLVHCLEHLGPLALENCRKSANRDGAFTDRAVGPAASKRIHKVFTGSDPSSTDV